MLVNFVLLCWSHNDSFATTKNYKVEKSQKNLINLTETFDKSENSPKKFKDLKKNLKIEFFGTFRKYK